MERRTVGYNFERDPPSTIPAMLGLIWLSGFRGEDLNVKVNYIRQTRDTKRWQKFTWLLAR
jgi:hypothetical protein